MSAKILDFIYRGGKTKRFHTADTLTEQNVAEHSFGVAWLVVLLYPSARKEVILAALAHDLAEHIVGDVSSPTKRKYPALKAALDTVEGGLLKDIGLDYEKGLTDIELKILKIADMLDGMMFCVRERKMGSSAVEDIYYNFYNYVKEANATNLLNTKPLLETINTMWEHYHVG